MDMSSLNPAQVPALTPPAGEIPNFVDAETRTPLVRSVVCVTMALMLVFLILRIYTRLKTTGSFDADDYLCVSAAAGVIAYTGVILSTVTDTLGRHQWNVPITDITLEYVTGSILSIILYSVAAVFVKTTLLVFYLRIFRRNYTANILAWGGIVVIVLFYLISIIVLLANCIPMDQQVPGKDPTKWAEKRNNRCGQPNLDLSAAQGVFSAITDLYVLAVPIHSVLALQLQTKKKIGVLAVFLTGLLSCACSLAAAYFRFTTQKSGQGDYTWNNTLPYILCTTELNVGIICSCLPVTFVIFKGFNMRVPVISFVRYFRTRSRGKQSSPSNPAEARDSSSHLAKEVDTSSLPRIPRATLTGLRTFIGRANSHRTLARQSKKITVKTELSTFDELASTDGTSQVQPPPYTMVDSYTVRSDPAFMFYSYGQGQEPGRVV